MNKSAQVDKNKIDDKGKSNVEEIKDKNEKIWVRKDESKAASGSIPKSGVGSSSGN